MFSRIRSKILWVLFAVGTGAAISTMVYGMAGGGWAYFGPVGGLAASVAGLVGLGVRPRWSNYPNTWIPSNFAIRAGFSALSILTVTSRAGPSIQPSAPLISVCAKSLPT